MLAALAVFGLSLLVFQAGSLLSSRAREPLSEPPPELGATRVVFESASAASIVGWYSPPEPGGPTVVASHGIRGSKRHLAAVARFLRSAGYGVLLYDAQGHGESSGDAITFGFREAHDAAAAVRFAREDGGGRVGFIGPSLAGAAALLGPEPLRVEALVLEAVYSTLEKAVTNRIAIRLGDLVAPLLTHLLFFQVEPRLGFDPYALNPIDRIPEASAPILVIAGTEDRHTTLHDSRALFAAAPEPKALWVIPGAAHGGFHRYFKPEYEEKVGRFLATHLRAVP